MIIRSNLDRFGCVRDMSLQSFSSKLGMLLGKIFHFGGCVRSLQNQISAT
jgi:hypothetical protein